MTCKSLNALYFASVYEELGYNARKCGFAGFILSYKILMFVHTYINPI
jgi:hypothetical protein